jgi:hypothetical protein
MYQNYAFVLIQHLNSTLLFVPRQPNALVQVSEPMVFSIKKLLEAGGSDTYL